MIRDTTSHSFYWSNRKLLGKEEAEGSLGDLGSANRYAYANDDPVNMIDPSGKDARACVAAILAAALLDTSAFGALYLLASSGVALTIDIPYVGPVIASIIIVGSFFVAVDVFTFIFNTAIAPYCGLSPWPYLPLPSAG